MGSGVFDEVWPLAKMQETKSTTTRTSGSKREKRQLGTCIDGNVGPKADKNSGGSRIGLPPRGIGVVFN